MHKYRSAADDVRNIFKEIFDSQEKFLIMVVGGYGWRGGARSEHSFETAIDSNPDENAFIATDGTILSGSSYIPDENPHSLPSLTMSVMLSFSTPSLGTGVSQSTKLLYDGRR